MTERINLSARQAAGKAYRDAMYHGAPQARSWDELAPEQQESYIVEIEPYVQAAARYLWAEGYKEGYSVGIVGCEDDVPFSKPENPYGELD